MSQTGETVSSGEQVVTLPDVINEDWLMGFSQTYGGEAYEVFLRVEDWLVQPPKEIGSAYYDLEDQMGPNGWAQTVKGKLWSGGFTHTPQYPDSPYGAVLALLDARKVLADGTEVPLIETNADRHEYDGTRRLVLVRLDRVVGDKQVTLSITN
jgi:hypothetical protein